MGTNNVSAPNPGRSNHRPTGKTDPPAPFITLSNITVRIGGTWLLKGLSWQMRDGENWVVWGANGAGKSTLAKALLGQAAVVQGAIDRHYRQYASGRNDQGDMALVSSDQQLDLHRREQMLDQMRHFSGHVHEVTRAGQVVEQYRASGKRRAAALRLAPLLAKPINALSAGEMRRLLIGRAVMSNPRLLILDEPFNGLDAATRHELLDLLNELSDAGTRMVLITHRAAEFPESFTHLLHLDQGRVVWSGPLQNFKPGMDSDDATAANEAALASPRPVHQGTGAPIIEMRGVHVAFGATQVLADVSWTMRAGENWALVGPNGAGKSTLLKLITGDQLQGYANEIILFGRPKGSGESVWEIKQHIGYVADDLQMRYQKTMSGFDVVCSGFFDSVGLYRLCSEEQKAGAHSWLRRTGVSDLAKRPFSKLSFGQQRMLLIVRAMVKCPRLLILDEPCNGLDATNRRRLLAMLDTIGHSGSVNLLYVSHRSDEMPGCITHQLHLRAGRVEKEVRD